MKVISSQHYINPEIVAQKMAELAEETSITLNCYTVGSDVEDGDLVILYDGHHTLAAARELGIEVNFEECDHPEGLTGEQLLAAEWNDGDWYYVENGHYVW